MLKNQKNQIYLFQNLIFANGSKMYYEDFLMLLTSNVFTSISAWTIELSKELQVPNNCPSIVFNHPSCN